jgi:hypothetical protein
MASQLYGAFEGIYHIGRCLRKIFTRICDAIKTTNA